MSITSRNNIESRPVGTADPFELPKAIVDHLQTCVDAHHSAETAEKDLIRFVWLDMRHSGRETLSSDEWLNVIDEAASLGTEFAVACVGASPSECPEIWDVVKWAQTMYGLKVGIHITGDSLNAEDVRHLERVNAGLTILFAPPAALAGLEYIERLGIVVRSAEVCGNEPICPCRLPKNLIYVGSRGVIYSCGLVSGLEEYCLGHILEKPLGELVEDSQAPELSPDNLDEEQCNGCPARLFKDISH